MRAFHFRLQTLLNLREMAREEALSVYAQAIRQRELEQMELIACNRRLKELREEIGFRRKEGFTGAEQATFLRAVNLSRDRLRRQHVKANQAKRAEEKARSAFVEADGNEKSLARLKDRKEEEHFRFELKKEERELEDVIGARYGRSQVHNLTNP